VAHSIRLLCGQRTLDWESLEKTCWSSVQAWVHNKDPYGFAISESTGGTVVLQKLVYSHRCFQVLIRNHREKESIDLRDKVYALMGIVLRGQDQYRPLFKIDYRLPIVDVYAMVLDYIHAEAKDLNIYQSKSLAFLRANLELNGKPEGATLPFLQSKPECMRCCLRAVY
jgi:hypothetical protein